MAKYKLLIVGSFPFLRKDYKDNTFHGGIVTSSKVIIDNLKTEKFRLILLDSSQNSLHPPGKIGRAYGALKRIITLISLLVAKKPDAALIFASDGWSAIEKGFMIWICNCAKCETLIFPRAGNLIQQILNEYEKLPFPIPRNNIPEDNEYRRHLDILFAEVILKNTAIDFVI